MNEQFFPPGHTQSKPAAHNHWARLRTPLMCRLLWYALVVACGLQPLAAQQKPTVKKQINTHWQFTKDPLTPGSPHASRIRWQPVNLPHTWNAGDVMDDTPGYYRGACWYRKDLQLDASYRNRQLFLHFEGANQQTEVYVNGKKAGTHTGGYTAFTVPLTDYLKAFAPDSHNEILVRVDNRFNEAVPPLSADFTFYGGLYRDVWLEAKAPVHFATESGATAVYVSTPAVTASAASVNIKSRVRNESAAAKRLILTSVIHNREGAVAARKRTTVSLMPGSVREINQRIAAVPDPHLWSPDDPYCYTVQSTITDAATGAVLDEVRNTLGFRWFRFDPQNGFFLNGRQLKLIGTSRHQDFPGLGNALPDSLACRDLVLLKQMGANFLRVAHYPQDPCVLQVCDSLGLLASVEIPVVNEITESEAFYRNCENMQREMIRQNVNHPSVILWCFMNEVLLKPHFNEDKARQKTYFANIAKLAKRLDSLTKQEDPSRPTLIANHGDLNKYAEAGLVTIPDVVGWNLYSGWYGGELKNFPAFLDRFHQRYPQKPVMVTEYGADADPRIHSFAPVRFDKSVEYTTLFHRYYLAQIRQKAFVSGGVIWNLADFNSESRTESMPHINNKGLLQWDRTPKDAYYFYQVALSRKPATKILASTPLRTGMADSRNACLQLLQVASNADSVELFASRGSLGKQLVDDGLCTWSVPFTNGENRLLAVGKKAGEQSVDSATILFRLQPQNLQGTTAGFQPLNILMCRDRYFTDDHQVLWQPTKDYRAGSWGSVGGRPFRIDSNSRLPFGSDRNIVQTPNDPIYQTQWVGIQQYRFDLPPGTYDLTLHFAELLGGPVPAVPYNLSDAGRTEPAPKRIFSVWVNDSLLIPQLNLAAQYGVTVPVEKTVSVTVTGQEGLVIQFQPQQGEAVLNALQVKKKT